MMRSKPASSMQKTYDECYLMCSTAVYFEGQNNEPEALRSWRSARDAISYHNAHRVPSNYTPKNETERALQTSLRDLELQCKERVDLLETLRESRKEAGEDNANGSPRNSRHETGQPQPQTAAGATSPGWLGDGTIPPLSYPELSRPPTLPPRPSPKSRASLEVDPTQPPKDKDRPGIGRRSSSNNSPPRSYSSPPSKKMSSEQQPPPSPEKKKTLLTTLRGKDPKSPSGRKKDSPRKISRPAASKAAGLAWNTNPQQPPTSGNESAGPAATTPRRRGSGDAGKGYFNEDLTAMRPPPFSRPSLENSSGESLRKTFSAENPKTNLAAGAAAAATNKPGDVPSPNDSSEPPTLSLGSSQSQPPKPLPNRPKPRPEYPTYRNEFPDSRPPALKRSPPNSSRNVNGSNARSQPKSNKPDEVARRSRRDQGAPRSGARAPKHAAGSDDEDSSRRAPDRGGRSSQSPPKRPRKKDPAGQASKTPPSSDHPSSEEEDDAASPDTAEYHSTVRHVMKNLPKGADPTIARQILNEIVVRGDEVHWDDVAGLEAAKKALKEAVVYPFLRPDLFMGLREPARGMLLFGPPGTGKTMLARAVATESKSTFFSVSASSLTSKWHGESEKLVRALFALAKAMAPSIIFVDEIDSLLSSRSTAGEAEASRRSKTEFLIQWSDLQRAAAGREQSDKEKREGDPTRVLVLAATNMPWDIDEAARRRFVRRQYIPLPEDEVRKLQFQKLLSQQNHELSDEDIDALVKTTDGFSGSDITSLAKDAAMGPLRNLGEALLHTPMDQICPIRYTDFEASLQSIRPSINREGLREYEAWAKEYGERGG